MIYRDGKNGSTFIKRFNVSGVTRDKFYDLTQEKAGSQTLYFSANPNGEAEVVTILLRQVGSVKKLKWDVDFTDIATVSYTHLDVYKRQADVFVFVPKYRNWINKLW